MDRREKRIRRGRPTSSGAREFFAPIIHHPVIASETRQPSSIVTTRAFTLIELLVVISILTMLMAILLPTLQRVRKQAKAVACQARLRQWGVVFSMYMNEYNDRFSTNETQATAWWRCSRWYRADCNDLLLCPMAARHEAKRNYSGWTEQVTQSSAIGSKYAAWTLAEYVALAPTRKTPLYGSYGVNLAMISTYAPEPSAIKTARSPGRFSMPFLLDCASWQSYGQPKAEPPAYDGDLEPDRLMKVYCINRHTGAINTLFMDWSVCTVGLKGLWALKWHAKYDTAGPWTKAGGVKPEDWPEWMRSFKDH